MKKSIYILLVCFVITALLLVLINYSGDTNFGHPFVNASNNHTPQLAKNTPGPSSPSIQNRDDELRVRTEASVSIASLGLDPAILEQIKQATDDPALIQILAKGPPAVGTLKPIANNRVVLDLGNGHTFEAADIGSTRSQAKDGTVAFDAITVPNGKRIQSVDRDAQGVGISGNASEVWIITRDGNRERISPSDVHAEHAIISPDGRYVAFAAQSLVDGMLHPKVLMIKDRVAGQFSSYAERKYGLDYEISPVDWVEDGKVLRVVDDWGETGGHLKLKEVRVRQ